MDAADQERQAHRTGGAAHCGRFGSGKLIDKKEAVKRIDAAALDQLLHPTIDPKAERKIIATGLPAAPGAACGEIVFSSDEAEALKSAGHKVILVRVETSPEDIHGMHAAEGILTTRGGMTSHAAVSPAAWASLASQAPVRWGRLSFADVNRWRNGAEKGETLTIDGSTRRSAGAVPMLEPVLAGEFATIMKWADELRTLKVRANADTPADARAAIKFGAEGIGLCRTEHMFFDEDRIRAMREMILAEDEAARRTALAKLLPMQRSDFRAV